MTIQTADNESQGSQAMNTISQEFSYATKTCIYHTVCHSSGMYVRNSRTLGAHAGEREGVCLIHWPDGSSLTFMDQQPSKYH